MTVLGLTPANPFATSSPSANALINIHQQIAALFRDVRAGNLSAAQSDLDAVNQSLGRDAATGNPTDATATSGATAGQTRSLSQVLGQIGGALQSGDIAGAQGALSTFETQARQSRGAGEPAPAHHDHHHLDAGSSVNDALASLIASVQSGDLAGAQNSFATLSGDAAASTTDGSSTPESPGGAGATSGQTPTDSPSGPASNPATAGTSLFAQFLAGLGATLQNNDLAAAQRNLTSFAQSWKTGSAVNLTA